MSFQLWSLTVHQVVNASALKAILTKPGNFADVGYFSAWKTVVFFTCREKCTLLYTRPLLDSLPIRWKTHFRKLFLSRWRNHWLQLARTCLWDCDGRLYPICRATDAGKASYGQKWPPPEEPLHIRWMWLYYLLIAWLTLWIVHSLAQN